MKKLGLKLCFWAPLPTGPKAGAVPLPRRERLHSGGGRQALLGYPCRERAEEAHLSVPRKPEGEGFMELSHDGWRYGLIGIWSSANDKSRNPRESAATESRVCCRRVPAPSQTSR